MNIYVASSWRNKYQQEVVWALREAGHTVYDFRNPRDGDHGFSWKQTDPEWEQWSTEGFIKALKHPVAESGYLSDYNAMRAANACVLVTPSGRSAHLEAGWMAGQGKFTAILVMERSEPELMYKMAHLITPSLDAVKEALNEQDRLRRIRHSGGGRYA